MTDGWLDHDRERMLRSMEADYRLLWLRAAGLLVISTLMLCGAVAGIFAGTFALAALLGW